MALEASDWVGILGGAAAIITSLGWVGTYLNNKRKLANEATQKGAKINRDLEERISELNINLHRAVASFELLMPLLEEDLKDNPAMLEAIKKLANTISLDDDQD